MHLALRHMAALLIVLYLFIPVMGFAHVGSADVGVTEIRSQGEVAGSPCDHCPCSNEQGTHCCDSTFCSCAFQSPLVQGVRVHYAPVEILSRRSEPFRMLPQVYLSIVVPPQNQYPERFLMLSHVRIVMPLRVVSALQHNPDTQDTCVNEVVFLHENA